MLGWFKKGQLHVRVSHVYIVIQLMSPTNERNK